LFTEQKSIVKKNPNEKPKKETTKKQNKEIKKLITTYSRLFDSGKMRFKTSFRFAAITFSLIPPIGNTLPVKEISPVIAKLGLTNHRKINKK
jgi:hypothetical protein